MKLNFMGNSMNYFRIFSYKSTCIGQFKPFALRCVYSDTRTKVVTCVCINATSVRSTNVEKTLAVDTNLVTVRCFTHSPLSRRWQGSVPLCDISTKRLTWHPTSRFLPKRCMGKVAEAAVEAFPMAWKPYLKLARINKPTGTWLLFWPCGWSIALAAPAGCLPDLYTLTLFGLGALVMRSSGCIINDIWDRDLDAKVARTKDRPIASGEISLENAVVFLAGQLGVGCIILLQLNWYSVVLGASSLLLILTYPLFKRFSYYPQFILGFTFSWGAMLGWSAVHGCCNWSVCLPLYISGVCWTVVYDTIYALQDKTDDMVIGIKSTAIKWSQNIKPILGLFSASMIAGLGVTGIMSDQTWPYYTALVLTAAHFSNQVMTLDIDNPSDSASKFASNIHVGFIIFAGIIAGTLIKFNEADSSSSKLDSKQHRSISNVNVC